MPLNPAGVPSRAAIQQAIDDAVDAAMVGKPHREAAGTITMSISGTSSANAAITFPPGRFTVPPIVSCTIATAPGGSAKLVPRAINVNSGNAIVYLYTGDGTNATASNVVVHWTARQMTPTAAAG